MSASSAKVRTITRIAMFAAILAVCSQIAIPLPSGVPVTLQTFAVGLVGYALGAKQGPVAVLVWCAIGLVGAPVFSNFMGGPAVLFGKTGGFIYGFLPMALLCGLAAEKKLPGRIFLSAAGLLLCHLCGVLQFSLLTGMDLLKSALLVSLPYLVKDLISMALAERFAAALRRIPAFAHTKC